MLGTWEGKQCEGGGERGIRMMRCSPSMEQTPADARAAPSASEPNDTVMDIHASPKRQRESSQGNMVRQRATTNAPLGPESQSETTDLLS
eukprot:scaffold9926_cov117-Isochrysis_galbana.AAC.6